MQKNFGTIGTMAPAPLSLKTRGGGGGGGGGFAYKNRAQPPPPPPWGCPSGEKGDLQRQQKSGDASWRRSLLHGQDRDKTQDHRSSIEQWLAVGGGWWLVAVGGERWVTVGGWWLVVVGGWRWALGSGGQLAVGIGRWWSLRAVLKGCPQQKKRAPKDSPVATQYKGRENFAQG